MIGERIDNNEFLVLNLGHVRTHHLWSNKDISSPFMRLFYVKAGQAVIHLEETDITLTPGHMYLLPAYVPHSYVCQPEFEFYYLFVYRKSDNVVDVFERLDVPFEVKANEACQQLFGNYCDLYPQLNLPSLSAAEFNHHPSYHDYALKYVQMEEYERLQLRGLSEILFSYFMKHATPRQMVADTRIAHLLNFIQQHLHEPISVETLANEACMTKGHLIRLFRELMGSTPLQYILRKKIQKAQAMLLGSELTVNEVARLLGFQEPSYFIRQFRKQIGVTPQEYRTKLVG